MASHMGYRSTTVITARYHRLASAYVRFLVRLLCRPWQVAETEFRIYYE
jgi:hypothetical protein